MMCNTFSAASCLISIYFQDSFCPDPPLINNGSRNCTDEFNVGSICKHSRNESFALKPLDLMGIRCHKYGIWITDSTQRDSDDDQIPTCIKPVGMKNVRFAIKNALCIHLKSFIVNVGYVQYNCSLSVKKVVARSYSDINR